MRDKNGLTKFAELTIGDDQSTQCAQTIKSLVAMLLSGSSVERSARNGSIATGDESCLPQEVLQQIALIFGQEQDLGLLNDIAKIGNQVSTL